MIEKPKRPKKIPNQDNKQPQTIEQLIRRYDLDNTKIYDFLDELVGALKETQTVVSVTEPTENNRGKVWIQKGKNLVNKKNIAIGFYIPQNSTDESLTASSNALTTDWIPCLPNESYTVSGSDRNRWQTKTEDGVITYQGESSRTLTTNATARYFRCYFYANYSGTLPNVQIEQGTVVTAYEAYVEPKIYVLNDNGAYEEFISKDNLVNYSTSEQRIGTWINGKTLYRKTFVSDYSTLLSLSVNNIESIVNTNMIMQRKDYLNMILSVPCRTNETNYLVTIKNIQVLDTKVEVGINYGTFWTANTINKIYTTLEYTKTTD